MSRSLLGGHEHQITHANIGIELKWCLIHGKIKLRLLKLTGLIMKKRNCDISNTLNAVATS